MTPLAWIGLAAAGAWVYKKKPEWIPAPIRPKHGDKKVAALANVQAASRPTPSPTAGLDPNMSSAEVHAANALLASGTDSAAMYSMASDYSSKGYVKTSEALIQKADAIETAKKHGADDQALQDQMMAAANAGAAGGAAGTVTTTAPTGTSLGEKLGKLFG